MYWKKIIAIGLTGCFLFSGCAEQRQNAQKMGEEGTQEDSYESTTFAMDTVMTFHIVAPDGEDLLIDAEQEVKRLEKLFSVTDEDSDIEQINDNAGDKAVTVSADTLALLKAGKQLGKATQETLDELLPLTKVSNVTIDEDASTVYLEKEGMAVDLGGIAKGYASDKLAELLKKKGVKSAWLSLGGNVCAIGTKPDGSPWRIAVQNPADENDYVGVVEISDACAVTSGGYQRYFEENGKKYHHIIDPATGKPAESGLTSVTIICKDGTKADALSTALYVMGLDDALAYWKTQDDFEVIFVTEDGEVVATEGLKDSFTFDGKGNDYTYRVAKR